MCKLHLDAWPPLLTAIPLKSHQIEDSLREEIAQHIFSICCPTVWLQEDDPCLRATLIKDAPQPPPCLHTAAAMHAFTPAVERVPPHPMAPRPCFGKAKFWPSRKNQISSNYSTTASTDTNSKADRCTTRILPDILPHSTQNMLHQFLTLWHKNLYLELSYSHRTINLLPRVWNISSLEF